MLVDSVVLNPGVSLGHRWISLIAGSEDLSIQLHRWKLSFNAKTAQKKHLSAQHIFMITLVKKAN
jgi:hypothetical protein